MHINDVYALESVLKDIVKNQAVSMKTINSLLDATHKEIQEFEEYIELQAEAYENSKLYYAGEKV